MSATFVLAARFGAPERRLLAGRVQAAVGRSGRACYVGAANGDAPGWTAEGVALLEGLGLEVAAPRLSRPRLEAGARAALDAADVLFLAGGDTVALCEHVARHGLLDAFQAAGRRARLVFGVSAGACAVAPFTIGYGDDGAPRVAPCLGMGPPGPLDVHDEADGWPELRALLELLPAGATGLAIPSGAALVVRPDGALCSWGRVACERRRLVGGAWAVASVPFEAEPGPGGG